MNRTPGPVPSHDRTDPADAGSPEGDAFLRAPNRTLVLLSLPVLLSLIAEPLTGLADTAFVAQLGSVALSALGVGTIVLSGSFWIFNFLGIGTQTEVAQALGARRLDRAVNLSSLAFVLAAVFGLVALVAGWVFTGVVASAMAATGEVRDAAILYIRIRLLAAPAVLVTTVAFGALRGLQDMRSPMVIAIAVNVLNIVLDAALIPGIGPIPGFGIAGAAWATVFSQCLGAAWALLTVRRKLGLSRSFAFRDAGRLLVVGRDLFLRTGLLTLFLLLTTRAATRIGADAGAAHQAIRQVWVLTALILDAFAATAQSLVGYYIGAGRREALLKVARVASAWSFGTGVALALAMWAGQGVIATLLVPADGRAIFAAAWMMSALFQPVNALSFATDGLHWGTGDYRYLRNAMIAATSTGAAALHFTTRAGMDSLAVIWLVTGGWITIRAVLGIARIWPGVGKSPFAASG